jgi:hypothetical protein
MLPHPQAVLRLAGPRAKQITHFLIVDLHVATCRKRGDLKRIRVHNYVGRISNIYTGYNKSHWYFTNRARVVIRDRVSTAQFIDL